MAISPVLVFFFDDMMFHYTFHYSLNLLPTGSEDRGVLGIGSIPVTILPSCQDMKSFAL